MELRTFLVSLLIYVFIYLTLLLWAGWDTRPIYKWSIAGLNCWCQLKLFVNECVIPLQRIFQDHGMVTWQCLFSLQVCIYQYLPRQDVTQGQFLSRVLLYYLPIDGGRIIVFIPFPRILAICEMQSVWSRIWICVTMSISYDDNHYTTSTSLQVTYDRLYCSTWYK